VRGGARWKEKNIAKAMYLALCSLPDGLCSLLPALCDALYALRSILRAYYKESDTVTDDAVIKVENLSKQYRIGTPEAYKTFRETLVDIAKAPFLRMRGTASKALGSPLSTLRSQHAEGTAPLSALSSKLSSHDDTIWALKEVSFEVERGEVVGIIGRNGAGKTTLLKILSRITEPTKGRVELRGRVGSLLEVGTGFHSELTGHENIYLYGAILGMDRWEVTRKFDEIVAFAELEKFIDTPIKRYSSGMCMRLAFAVAAHLEPEILLVDEVLAVGDLAFQKKCLGKMGDISKEGRTVLFVSHNMGAVRNLCQNALILNSGVIQNMGNVFKIVDEYENYEISDKQSVWVNHTDEEKKEIAYIEKIEILDKNLKNKDAFLSSECILVKFSLHVREANPNLKFGFDLLRNGETVFRSQQVDSPKKLDTLCPGDHTIFCEIPAKLLNLGDYYIIPLLSIHLIKGLIKESIPVIKFRVILDSSESDFHILLNEWNHPGPVFPLLNWELR